MTKTLLIVGSVPGTSDVGQFLTQEMLECVNLDDYIIAALLSEKEEANYNARADAEGKRYRIKVFRRPQEFAQRPFSGAIGGMISAIDRLLTYDQKIANLLKEIEAYARQLNVERVWSILNTTSVIDVTYHLIKRLNTVLLTHVWDDVHHICQQQRLNSLMRQRTADRFGQLLNRSYKTAVICEAMSNEYTDHYGAKCEIVRYGFTDKVKAQIRPSSSQEFRIGFSGSMYCDTAWKTFLESLNLQNWRIGEKRIKFVVLSGQVDFSTRVPANVEYLGWRSSEEVLERLANCDLLYLPQSFAVASRALTELSFPTKLSSYVSVGRPILVHAPGYASVSRFYEHHSMGILCTSTSPEILSKKVHDLATDSKAYEMAAQSVSYVAEKKLSHLTFVRQTENFLSHKVENRADRDCERAVAFG